MTDSFDEKYAKVYNPEIRKLIKSLEHLPEYLENRRRKMQKQKEFARYVFEDALRKAGLLDRKLHPDVE